MLERRVRRAFAGLFVLAQLVAIVLGQLGPTRYASWAPLHEHARYRILARRAGLLLSAAEVDARYELSGMFRDAASGEDWELNAIEHVFDRIRRREQLLPPPLRAEVSVVYRRNGGEATTWTLPR